MEALEAAGERARRVDGAETHPDGALAGMGVPRRAPGASLAPAPPVEAQMALLVHGVPSSPVARAAEPNEAAPMAAALAAGPVEGALVVTQGTGGPAAAPAHPQGVAPLEGRAVRGRSQANAAAVAVRTESSATARAAPAQSALQRKATYRPSDAVAGVLPSASAMLGSAPTRRQFAEGDDGDAEFERQMEEFLAGVVDGGGQTRALDAKECEVGRFGDFLEASGYGKFVHWVLEGDGYTMRLCGSADVAADIPSAVSMIDYVVALAQGNAEVCPKGGRIEYANGPWYKPQFGKDRGEMMGARKQFGYGAYASEPTRVSTIEQKMSKIRTWLEAVLSKSPVKNPARDARLKKLLSTLARIYGRRRVHSPEVLDVVTLRGILAEVKVDAEDVEEVLIAAYMAKNLVTGRRAADEWLLDWANVRVHAGERGERRGVALQYEATKNNKEQRDSTIALDCVDDCEGEVVRRAGGRKLDASKACPPCLLRYARRLQEAKLGLAVGELEGPVYSQCEKLGDLEAGATLVLASDESDAAQRVGSLVCVVTLAQEALGLRYDRTAPFVVDGRALWPPIGRTYFEVVSPSGVRYAVSGWATAAGVTAKMRALMRKLNRRSATEVVAPLLITKLSSKSMRISMATLLSRAGVPMAEVTALGEWEDEAMTRTYIRNLEPFAIGTRNYSEVLLGGGEAAAAPRVEAEVAAAASHDELGVSLGVSPAAAEELPEGAPAAIAPGLSAEQALQASAALAAVAARLRGSGAQEASTTALGGESSPLAGEPPVVAAAAEEEARRPAAAEAGGGGAAADGAASLLLQLSGAAEVAEVAVRADAAAAEASPAVVAALGLDVNVGALTLAAAPAAEAPAAEEAFALAEFEAPVLAEMGEGPTAEAPTAEGPTAERSTAEGPTAEAPPAPEPPVPAPARARRRKDDDPQYKPCCEGYVGNPFKKRKLADDPQLQALLATLANEWPSEVQRRLHAAGYHLTRREYTNWEAREKEKRRCAALVAPSPSALEAALLSAVATQQASRGAARVGWEGGRWVARCVSPASDEPEAVIRQPCRCARARRRYDGVDGGGGGRRGRATGHGDGAFRRGGTGTTGAPPGARRRRRGRAGGWGWRVGWRARAARGVGGRVGFGRV